MYLIMLIIPYLQINGYLYLCEIGRNRQTYTAIVHNSSTIICNMSNNTLRTSQAQENVSMRLIWTNMNDTHYIESNIGNDQKGLYYIN